MQKYIQRRATPSPPIELLSWLVCSTVAPSLSHNSGEIHKTSQPHTIQPQDKTDNMPKVFKKLRNALSRNKSSSKQVEEVHEPLDEVHTAPSVHMEDAPVDAAPVDNESTHSDGAVEEVEQTSENKTDNFLCCGLDIFH